MIHDTGYRIQDVIQGERHRLRRKHTCISTVQENDPNIDIFFVI